MTQSHQLGELTVTAVLAQHGPPEAEQLTGPVKGFVLSGSDASTVYVSGDNASLDVVQAIANRFPRLDVTVLFAGAARTPVTDTTLTLTRTGRESAIAADMIGRPHVLVAHTDEWAHLTEGYDEVVRAFRDAGTEHLLIDNTPGRRSIVQS